MVERVGEWYPFSSQLYCRRLIVYDTLGWAQSAKRDYAVNSTSTSASAAAPTPPHFPECACIAMAPFGGPVAVVVAETVSDARDGDMGTAEQGAPIDLYSSGGDHMASWRIPGDAGPIVAVGWNKEEGLVVLTAFHCYLLYSVSAAVATFRKDPRATPTPCAQLRLAERSPGTEGAALPQVVLVGLRASGLIYVDDRGTLRGVLSEERRQPFGLSPVSLDPAEKKPCAIDFIARDENDDGETYVYLALRPTVYGGESSLLIARMNTAGRNPVARHLIPGEITEVKLSHDGARLAVYTTEATLHVFTSNMSAALFSICLGARGRRPVGMSWCGSRCVLLNFNAAAFDTLHMPDAECPMFSLLVPTIPGQSPRCERLDWDADGSGHIVAVAEIDGARVLTEKRCYFVEEVAECLVNLCRMAPLSPSARFVSKYHECAAGGVKSVVDMHAMLGRMGKQHTAMVDELIDAAAHEFDTGQQHKILAAAAFANQFCCQYDSETFVDVVRRLRLLNVVRSDDSCHMPISFRQYAAMSATSEKLRAITSSEAQVLIDRLTNRCQFQMALDVCQLLKGKNARVLVQWSCYRVQQATATVSDKSVYEDIRSVLSLFPNSCYIEAALAAFHQGRSQLAVRLLSDEPQAPSKVTLLLRMREVEIALANALESRNWDLTFLVLSQVSWECQRCREEEQAKQEEQLFRLLIRYPAALPLVLRAAIELPWWREVASRFFCGVQPPSVSQPRPFAYFLLCRLLAGDFADEQQPQLKRQLASGARGRLKKPDSALSSIAYSVADTGTARSRERLRRRDREVESDGVGTADSDVSASYTTVELMGTSTNVSEYLDALAPADRTDEDGETELDIEEISESRGTSVRAPEDGPGLVPVRRHYAQATSRLALAYFEDIRLWLEPQNRASTVEKFVAETQQGAIGLSAPTKVLKTATTGSPRSLLTTGETAVTASVVAAHEAQWLSRHQELARLHDALGSECGNRQLFRNQTIMGTLYICFQRSMEKHAAKIQAQFGVSSTMYCFTQLRAYCGAEMWGRVDALGGFSVSSSGSPDGESAPPKFIGPKPCIGFRPFVDELARRQRHTQAAKFVARLGKIEERIELYVSMGLLLNAIDDAAHEQDVELIDQILQRTSSSQVHQYGAAKKQLLGG